MQIHFATKIVHYVAKCVVGTLIGTPATRGHLKCFVSHGLEIQGNYGRKQVRTPQTQALFGEIVVLRPQPLP